MFANCLLQYTPGKYEISRRENRCILKIKNADKDDAAEFSCEVEGDKTSCKVTLEGSFYAVVTAAVYIDLTIMLAPDCIKQDLKLKCAN